MKQPIPEGTICAVDFCTAPGVTRYKGSEGYYCKPHYQHLYNGREPGPVGTYRRVETKDGLRRCNGPCREWKSEDDYYRRKNGAFREMCKACCIKAEQRRKAERLRSQSVDND